MESPLAELLLGPQKRQLIEWAIVYWALVAARVTIVIQLVPYLGGKAVPQTVKIALTVAITTMIYPAIWAQGVQELAALDSPLAITALLIKEVLLGFVFGFVASLVFEALRIAGQLIDVSRGQTQNMSMAPQLPERISASANLLYQLHIVIFLLLGGHRIFLTALIHSFVAIPPHAFPALGQGAAPLVLGIVRLGADAITLGVALALPVIAALLLTDIALAMINKAAPQIQVFFLGMPIKALVGIAVVLLSLHLMVDRVMDEALGSVHYLEALIQGLDTSKER